MIGYLLAIALVIVTGVALAIAFKPPDGDRDIPPARLQQGGGWSEHDDEPDEDG